jgi:hypothetical protein
LKEVSLICRRGKASYTVENLDTILTFIRQRAGAVALWNDSGEAEALERFFKRKKLPWLCGCVADVLVRMGLASVQAGLPVRISSTDL